VDVGQFEDLLGLALNIGDPEFPVPLSIWLAPAITSIAAESRNVHCPRSIVITGPDLR
jgi:hypothetical protein